MIQGSLIQSSFEKDMFSKESEKSTYWNFDSIGCFTLSFFEKNLKKLDFGWLICQANSTNYFMFSIGWFFENLNKILLSWFNMF